VWRPTAGRVRSPSFDLSTGALRDLARRSREVVLLAALTGALTGLLVRFFEYFVVEVVYEHLLEQPLWVQAVAPGLGLVAAACILRTVGAGASPSTADDYLRAFHDPEHVVSPRAFAGKVLASVATLGSGAPMGLEGTSIYAGSGLGALIQRRLPAAFRGVDHRTLLVAGAAAGVAAIFKAPATGAIFALEVPFRDQMARRSLLPALVASASGYLTFVSLSNTNPIFSFDNSARIASFGVRDLFGAIMIGVGCAVGARAFARLLRTAKSFNDRPLGVRVPVAGVVLVLLFVVTRALTGESLTLGGGYEVIRWLGQDNAVWLLAVVFLIRCFATATAVAGGGVGGIFIPLVVGGAIVGRGVGELVDTLDPTLYVLLGMAAFLGAGYRVPLAAVVFVAETTGQPGFIVPALFAAVAADLVMGDASVTGFQRAPDDLAR
jgi:CIC family chloride channel protein